jgi:hypothetical protein
VAESGRRGDQGPKMAFLVALSYKFVFYSFPTQNLFYFSKDFVCENPVEVALRKGGKQLTGMLQG